MGDFYLIDIDGNMQVLVTGQQILSVSNLIFWCFLFCKEDVTLLQGALKKLLTSPVII